MKATILKSKITEIRSDEYFEIQDNEGQKYVIEGVDRGWRIFTESCSIMMRFDSVLVSGNDVYLAIEEEEGRQEIFATIDADMFEVCK